MTRQAIHTAANSPLVNGLSRRSQAKADHSSLPRVRAGDFSLSAFQRFSLLSVNARRAFTLLELLVVIGIISLLTALVVPTFTNLKSANDVTRAAYTIKGVVEQARTYAKANNTYTWVGFYEEDISKAPGNAGNGRLVISVVASNDGTTVYNPSSSLNPDPINPTKLKQIGKLTKIDNVHLPLFAVCTTNCTGDTFDTRPPLQSDPFGVGYNDSRFGELNSNPTAPTTNAKFPFQYPVGNPAPAAQYTFNKTLQFSPRGECSINSTYDVRPLIEIGLVATRASTVPTPTAGAGTSTATYAGNVVAVQVSGFGGSAKIYRR